MENENGAQIQKLLAQLREHDVRVWAEGDRLRVNGPKGVLTPELQGLIAANKQALLRFVGSVGDAKGARLPLVPVSRTGDLPLSYAQERLWFLHRFDPENPAYNVPAEILGGTSTTADAVERSLNALLKRHEILRTRFVLRDGQPHQVIDPFRPVRLPVVDLAALSGDDREREAARLSREEAGRPFDLERGPLVRFFLVERLPDRPMILITQHHIITDRWSLGVFARELSTQYHSVDAAKGPPLPELTLQYADFASWQRKWLEQGALASQLTYWRRQLGGALPFLELPTDRPRPPVRTYHGAWRWLELGTELAEVVRRTSREQNVTLFTLLVSVFVVLLRRYTAQTDITVGTPITGRGQKSLENLLGIFVNTLVLRANLSDSPSFRDLLQQVRGVALDAFSHADVPFERLVEELKPARDTSRSPLFQVMFVLQNAPSSVDVERIEDVILRPTGATMFDLTFTAAESHRGLTLTVEYNTDLFDAQTTERMLEHYRTLLRSAVATPEMPIDRLPLLPEQERRTQLLGWNATAVALPEPNLVHERFEACARREPEATAVVMNGSSLDYQTLNARSNQLARFLIASGVRRGGLVGVCLERSLDMLVTLLAILKAGGAYVPLDPGFPKRRLRFMLEDADLEIVVTKGSLDEGIAEGRGTKRLDLGADAGAIARESTADLPGEPGSARPGPEDLCYVIYTSGSTGTPKGVAVRHGALANFLTAMGRTPGLERDDVMLSVTTLSFDIAGLELYLPLTVGARLVIADEASAADGRALRCLIEASGATILQATPATWRLLLDAGFEAREGLVMLCGGEALPRELARALSGPGTSLWNLYGPTETTIWSTLHRVEPVAGAVPIGKPIANTQVYVVDEHFEPVPIGVTGELVIGGDGVALGYLGRPHLTADRFVPDPFGDKPGARLYRTGDLARSLRDGTFDYLGRTDQQVKVRGFRIELGDIEAVLERHSRIGEAAVVARDVPEGKALVAFCTGVGDGAPPASTELREHLRAHVPAYMIPSLFVALESLPLTPNGKVDRLALTRHQTGAAGPEAVFEAPRTPVEETIASIWREVLGRPRVGVHDNFFDLGGHSLMAAKVISRLVTAFSVEVPLRDLFEQPTVAELATFVVALAAEMEESSTLESMLAEIEGLSEVEARAILGAPAEAEANAQEKGEQVGS